jgi:hypothetical protein
MAETGALVHTLGPMLYAILCWDSEEVVGAWTKEEDAAAMTRLDVVQAKLLEERKLGPVGRLGPSKSARTIRKGSSLVTDGPFAETKEQILGFFIVDCASMEDAVKTAEELGRANPTKGAYEVRPLTLFRPGGPLGGSTSPSVGG